MSAKKKLSRKTARAISALAMIAALPASAATTTIDLSSEASRPAANDQVQATVFAEAAGAHPGELAKQVNALINEALKTAKAYPPVKTQSAGTHTYPVYGKSGKIDSWRMRSQLSLESADMAAVSELLSKLQGSLGIEQLTLQPSPETRKKAENEAMLDALAAFKARAKILADALGKPYRIKQLSVNTGGYGGQPVFLRRGATRAAEAEPMPMEGGESLITTTLSGQIELE